MVVEGEGVGGRDDGLDAAVFAPHGRGAVVALANAEVPVEAVLLHGVDEELGEAGTGQVLSYGEAEEVLVDGRLPTLQGNVADEEGHLLYG